MLLRDMGFLGRTFSFSTSTDAVWAWYPVSHSVKWSNQAFAPIRCPRRFLTTSKWWQWLSEPLLCLAGMHSSHPGFSGLSSLLQVSPPPSSQGKGGKATAKLVHLLQRHGCHPWHTHVPQVWIFSTTVLDQFLLCHDALQSLTNRVVSVL